jgi:hypothetical protein
MYKNVQVSNRLLILTLETRLRSRKYELKESLSLYTEYTDWLRRY